MKWLERGRFRLFQGQKGSSLFEVSGSYYNEVFVFSEVPIPNIFSDIGATAEECYNFYSWNLGAVIAPAYDSSANTSGVVLDTNMALAIDSISIVSY